MNFSETYLSYPDGQQNVGAPPDSVIATGFVPETAESRGQPLPAQWLNWLFRQIFRSINRDVVTDSNGERLFPVPDAMIRLEAIDRSDTNRYLVAVGWKAAASAPDLKVVAGNGLSLGSGNASGDQPVTGGTDVMVVGYSRQKGGV